MEAAREGHRVLGWTPEATARFFAAHGGTPAQAQNFMRELHLRRPEKVTDVQGVSRALLARMADQLVVERLTVDRVEHSTHSPGTRKLLLKTADGAPVETVIFPAQGKPERLTVCLSSQAGCRMACRFCATGAMGFVRQLSAAEIVAQVWAAHDVMTVGEKLVSVVFMGMGEPLDNEDELLDALHVLHDCRGFNLAWDKISVSTSGVLPPLERLRERLPRVSIAVSLHAVTDELRDEIVPINKKYPLAQLLDTMRRHPPKTGKRYCIEYCLLEGVNDSLEEAVELVKILEGIPCFIQLIPYNTVPGLPYKAPSREKVFAFGHAVQQAGGALLIRHSRGPDIGAACGQLGSEVARRTRASATSAS